jgi:hypothetical protein
MVVNQSKKVFSAAILSSLALMLSACGGGGGGGGAAGGLAFSGGSGDSGGSSSSSSGSTAPTSKISRFAANGTSVNVGVVISPSVSLSNPIYTKVTDPNNVFSPNVTVTANSDGTYTLGLSTSSTASNGNYSGTVVVSLCNDAVCNNPVQTVSVPYSVRILDSQSTWPGNTLTTLSAWSGVADWGTFQGNAAHTGYVPVTVNPDNFTTRWQLPTGCTVASFVTCNMITTANGVFFLAGSTSSNFQTDNLLYARKEYDGSVVWQYDFKDAFVSPPAAANGTVYVVAGQGNPTNFYGLKAKDGSLLFNSSMGSQYLSYLTPTIGASGIYTNGATGTGSTGGFYAFNSDGSQAFFTSMAQGDSWTPAVDANGVYAYAGGVLTVVDPKTGATLHSISDPTASTFAASSIGGSPVLGASGSVIMANYLASQPALVDFNVAKNSIAWAIAGSYRTTPAYASGIIYAANSNPFRLEARSEKDGSLLWSWTPPGVSGGMFEGGFTSEVLLTSNLIFVSTTLNTYAIDRTSHQMVWSYPASGHLALSANGILYIEGSNTLTAINLK